MRVDGPQVTAPGMTTQLCRPWKLLTKTTMISVTWIQTVQRTWVGMARVEAALTRMGVDVDGAQAQVVQE
jgi:hypothetical protein